MATPNDPNNPAPVPGQTPAQPPVQQGVQPPVPPIPPLTQPAPTDDPKPPDEELRFSREAFDKRLERERGKAQADFLKSMGFESMEAYEQWKADRDAEEEAKAQAEREKLSEIERYKADLAEAQKKVDEANAAQKAAAEEAEAARVEAHLHSVFAAKGIKNTDYAFFKIESKLNSLPDGEELDENAFLDELLADATEAAALGAGDFKGKPVPATTTQPKTGPAPKPPGANPNKHASEMDDAEWKAFKKAHGLA